MLWSPFPSNFLKIFCGWIKLHCNFFIHSLLDGNLGWVCTWALVNSTSIKGDMKQVSLLTELPSSICVGAILLDHIRVLVLELFVCLLFFNFDFHIDFFMGLWVNIQIINFSLVEKVELIINCWVAMADLERKHMMNLLQSSDSEAGESEAQHIALIVWSGIAVKNKLNP